MTPLGWARANMLYDMLAEPPTPGSPVESLMILVWQMRQDAQYYQIRAIVQASVEASDGGEAAQKAWGSFTDKYYPYLEGIRKRGDEAALKSFYKEADKRLTVTPLQPLTKKERQRRRAGKTADDTIMSRLWKRKNNNRPG
jgi:hypothetical protein